MAAGPPSQPAVMSPTQVCNPVLWCTLYNGIPYTLYPVLWCTRGTQKMSLVLSASTLRNLYFLTKIIFFAQQNLDTILYTIKQTLKI